MDFAFTHEHEELRQTVRKFMEKESSEATVRKLMETEAGFDRALWGRLASELSLLGLAIPEQYGGAGLGAVELAIVMEEMGRVLFCAPFLSSAVMASNAILLAADDAAKAKLLPMIAEGKSIGTVAVAEKEGRWNIDNIETRAKRDGSAWKLDGVKNYVIDGAQADIVLVVARTDDGVALFQVDSKAAGLERSDLPTLDLTRKLAQLTFKATPALRISSGDVSAALKRVMALAVTALAAEQVGGAQRCLEISTDYAKTRLQFGRPIGSFQAIKHKCADMLVDVEFARSAAYGAAFAAAGDTDDEFFTAAHSARSFCSETYFRAAADTIQIHGGMGFTWEHPAHLYFKRARASSVMFGDPAVHRQAVAASLGI
ncbi:MAG TPA: acyl-CoA dehydrogenase family protein [Candidatus Binataceae bacterium]|nr:acyl-CoA dehydrogenase family protein [Candidatus Binataceae bacterium]